MHGFITAPFNCPDRFLKYAKFWELIGNIKENIIIILKIPSRILISRTDSIGDVILTLPVCKILKNYFPQVKIGFLGKSYTRPVIQACSYVDVFIRRGGFYYKKNLYSMIMSPTQYFMFFLCQQLQRGQSS